MIVCPGCEGNNWDKATPTIWICKTCGYLINPTLYAIKKAFEQDRKGRFASMALGIAWVCMILVYIFVLYWATITTAGH